MSEEAKASNNLLEGLELDNILNNFPQQSVEREIVTQLLTEHPNLNEIQSIISTGMEETMKGHDNARLLVEELQDMARSLVLIEILENILNQEGFSQNGDTMASTDFVDFAQNPTDNLNRRMRMFVDIFHGAFTFTQEEVVAYERVKESLLAEKTRFIFHLLRKHALVESIGQFDLEIFENLLGKSDYDEIANLLQFNLNHLTAITYFETFRRLNADTLLELMQIDLDKYLEEISNEGFSFISPKLSLQQQNH